ncbi:MAG: nitroreductase family protein [Candidatus Woesearchaeota archaeon]
MNNIKKFRKPEYKIDKIFLKRWSPRAFKPEPITDEILMTIFEAGKWAASSYNHQPWRFIYAMRDTPEWDRLFNLLAEPNQMWAKNASALVLIISQTNFEFNNLLDKTHVFSSGTAFGNLSIQATIMGLYIHGMVGFDYGKARNDLGVPDDFEVMAMFAVGKIGNKENLPEDYQKMEFPSDRKKLKELVFEGEFKG